MNEREFGEKATSIAIENLPAEVHWSLDEKFFNALATLYIQELIRELEELRASYLHVTGVKSDLYSEYLADRINTLKGEKE